ncbi:MAG: hypothetical protein JWQ40_3533 [Segetibacter sp.]|jgi:hypothetical protein|nr:hypothetical protein [Segetibacter sp.]
MKKGLSLLLLPIFSSVILFAQTKDSVPAKSFEQKEINAGDRLKKELQQKQLTAPPERLSGDVLDDTKRLQKSKKAVAKSSSVHAVRRNGRCHKKLKQGTQKN